MLPINVMYVTKRCMLCGHKRPTKAFSKDRRTKDRLSRYCKDCQDLVKQYKQPYKK